MPKPIATPQPVPFDPNENDTPVPDTPLRALAAEFKSEQAEAMTDATDADVGGIPAENAQPEPIANATLVAQLVAGVRDTVCMLAGLEAPKKHLTDDKVQKLGEIWGGVLDHYGIQLSKKMGTYGPIIAAAVASAPLLRDTVMETRKEIIAKDATRPAALPAPAPAPAGAAVAPPPSGRAFTEGQIQPAFAR